MVTVVETPVVSTVVSQTPSPSNTTTDPIDPSSASPKPKRRKIIPNDNEPSPPPTTSKSSTLITIPSPVPLSSIQVSTTNTAMVLASVQYPLELATVRKEIKSSYIEDDLDKKHLPSLQGYPMPKNIEEYLKLKAQQAEDISNRDTQGKTDREIQRNFQSCSYKLEPCSSFEKNCVKNCPKEEMKH
ncbi:hypothetical protein Hanom_Chr08g00721131 [Helianthus anomalus]